MNQKEREAFEAELSDDLCKVGFRASIDQSTGQAQIVVNDIIKACMPAILSRIETENSKVPSPRSRKKVNLKDRAWKAYVAGWRDSTKYADIRLSETEARAIKVKFGKWWDKETGE